MLYLLSDLDQDAEFARRRRKSGKRTRLGSALKGATIGAGTAYGLSVLGRGMRKKGLTLPEVAVAGLAGAAIGSGIYKPKRNIRRRV